MTELTAEKRLVVAEALFKRGRTAEDPEHFSDADQEMRDWLLGHADAILEALSSPTVGVEPGEGMASVAGLPAHDADASATEALSDLDRAHRAVDALGGTFDPGDVYAAGYAAALTDAIKEIEKLGGQQVMTAPHDHKISSALEDRSELARAYLGLTAELYKITEAAPKTEPGLYHPMGGYLSDGNQEDCVRDGMLHEEWRLAELIRTALWANAPDGGVDNWALQYLPSSAEQVERDSSRDHIPTPPIGDRLDGLDLEAVAEMLNSIEDGLTYNSSSFQCLSRIRQVLDANRPLIRALKGEGHG